MKFNRYWTKEDNDLMRQLIKEGKDVDYIMNYFGEKIKYHPKGKYNHNYMKPFFDYLSEIKINPIETPYEIRTMSSFFYKNKKDHIIRFPSNMVFYVLYFMYFEIDNLPTYNIFFTTENQFDQYILKFENYTKKGYVKEDEFDDLKNIIEKETYYNDIYSIMKRLSFIIFDYHKNLKEKYFSIGETDNKIKIKLYRNIIKDSFENINEFEIVDKNENKYFVYEINND